MTVKYYPRVATLLTVTGEIDQPACSWPTPHAWFVPYEKTYQKGVFLSLSMSVEPTFSNIARGPPKAAAATYHLWNSGILSDRVPQLLGV